MSVGLALYEEGSLQIARVRGLGIQIIAWLSHASPQPESLLALPAPFGSAVFPAVTKDPRNRYVP